ncbi:zinc finger protein 26-like [Culicoides brevitarsis]|uniref:zinc finger protein 26-like n=1 Tax=Culicoides brevitarsis TaxID=469753 RepID=UPI00307CA1D8
MAFYTLNIVVNLPKNDLNGRNFDFLLESIQDIHENIVYTVNLQNNCFDCIKCNQKYILNVFGSDSVIESHDLEVKEEIFEEKFEPDVRLDEDSEAEKSVKTKKSRYKVESDKKKRTKYNCDTCKLRFSYRLSLQRHDCVKKYFCSLCKSSFNDEEPFHDHVTQCKPPKKKENFVCHLCGISFSYKSKYRYHLKHSRAHQQGPPKPPPDRMFECDHCSKKFPTKHTIFRHVRRHFPSLWKPQKPCICQICGQAFKQPRNLKHHVTSIHEGRKPFECHLCGKTFTSNSYLKIHLGHHEGAQNYPCKFCELKYRDPGTVASHMRRFHAAAYEEYKKSKKLATFE